MIVLSTYWTTGDRQVTEPAPLYPLSIRRILKIKVETNLGSQSHSFSAFLLFVAFWVYLSDMSAACVRTWKQNVTQVYDDFKYCKSFCSVWLGNVRLKRLPIPSLRKIRPRINIWIHLNSPTVAGALEIFSLPEKVNMNRRKTIDYTVTRRSRDSHSQLNKSKTRVDDRDRRDREEKKAKKPFWSGNDDHLVSWVVFSYK